MNVEDLLLKKEELPILNETRFYVPVHPVLMRPELEFDSDIAHRLFPQAAQEWYVELKEHTKSVEDPQIRKWYEDFFLKHEPEIKKTSFKQSVTPTHWDDEVHISDNGFATYFSLSRNAGGSLYLPPEGGCERMTQYVYPPVVLFSKEKFDAFDTDKDLSKRLSGSHMFVYLQHNVDYYPGALFLRNWVMLYLNEVMRSVDENLFNAD